jgi:predicted ABC-type ATPase
MSKPKFIIVAGINGAGKSTLYRVRENLFEDSLRINADEILRANNDDWRDDKASLRAILTAGKLINKSISDGVSFHTETTLAAKTKSYLQQIQRAHEAGFEVTLVYVSLKNVDLAIQRVKDRVERGGHGVPKERILERYDKSLENLTPISQIVDNVVIYDNSDKFILVYDRQNNSVLFDETALYPWINV